jgi:hypothetical protein
MSNGVQSNYMSDASILAWVEHQQDMQYGQLKDSMSFETARGEMLQDLAKLKSELREAGKSTAHIGEFNDDITAFLAKYGEVPEFEDIVGIVEQFAPGVNDKAEQNANLPQSLETFLANPPLDGDGNVDPSNPPTSAEPFNKGEIEGWSKSLDEIGDSASHNEQLAMIRINEIKSNIDHSADLASQLIKSSNDTTDAAIRNIV